MKSVTVVVAAFVLAAGTLWAQDELPVQIHGFVTQGFMLSTANNYYATNTSDGSGKWTEGAISFSRAFNKLNLGAQLHSYQLGQIGELKVTLDWAYVDYRMRPWLGFRAGKVKTPMGLFNETQDIDAVQPWAILPMAIYSMDNRDFNLSHTGFDVYGRLPLPRHLGSLSYAAYVGRHSVGPNSGYGYGAQATGILFNGSLTGKTYGGDLKWRTPLKGLLVGALVHQGLLSGTATINNPAFPPFLNGQATADSPKDLSWGSDAQFERGKFYAAAEFRRRLWYINAALGTVHFPDNSQDDERNWYVMSNYHLTSKLTSGGYVSRSHQIENRNAVRVGSDKYVTDWVVSGRYDLTPYLYLKAEEHFIFGDPQYNVGLYAQQNPIEVPNSKLFAMRLGFVF
jgi:hypothetical protein